MDASQKEELAREVNRALHNIHSREPREKETYTIPDGFIFGRDPQILALRIMGANTISEMPDPQTVRKEKSTFTLPDPKAFLEASSLRNENDKYLLNSCVVNVLYLKSLLDNEPSARLSRFNLTLAFSIDCRDSAQNGQPCCTDASQFFNAPDNLEDFHSYRKQALKEIGALLREEFWT